MKVPDITFDAVSIFAPLRLLSFLLIGYAGSGQSLRQSVQLTVQDNLLYIPVRVNGLGPYNFRLDSGNSGIAHIDRRLAKVLGLKIIGFQQNTAGTQVKRELLVAVGQLSVGKLDHSALQLTVGDYNPIGNPIPTDGTIGQNFFDGYLVMMDGPNRQWLVTKDTLSRQVKEVLRYSNDFVILGRVGTKELAFTVDVGSNHPFLFPKSSLAGIRYTDTANQQVVTLPNTSFVLQEAVIQDEIVLSGLRLTDQKVYYSDKVHQISVGTAFLKDHVVRFDQRRKLIRID